MKTRDEFVSTWQDELTGLLLASFAEEKAHTDMKRDGHFFIVQMRRARDLLGRMHGDLAALPSPQQPALPGKAATNGQPAAKAGVKA